MRMRRGGREEEEVLRNGVREGGGGEGRGKKGEVCGRLKPQSECMNSILI
jgi:hypothetical protein